MNVVTLDRVSKRFGEKIVFRDISLGVEAGGLYAITGKSGCGKSTLLNIMGGIERQTQGVVTVFGHRNVSARGGALRKLLRYKISFLFQNYALSDSDTVKYNLAMALHYADAGDPRRRITEALKDVGLQGYENQKVYTLSGGEQQRVALARLLLKPTELILADEPTGNLDAANRDVVFRLLLEQNKKGIPVVIATHDMELAHRCDHIISLSG